MRITIEQKGKLIIFLMTLLLIFLLGYLGYLSFENRSEYACTEAYDEEVKYDILDLSNLKIIIDQKYYLNYTSDPNDLAMYLPTNASLKKDKILNKFSFGKPGNILTIMHYNDSNYVYHLKMDGQYSFDFSFRFKGKELVLNRNTNLKKLSVIFKHSIKSLKCLDSYYAENENILKMKIFISSQNVIIGSAYLEFRNYFLSNIVFNYPHILSFQKRQYLNSFKKK